MFDWEPITATLLKYAKGMKLKGDDCLLIDRRWNCVFSMDSISIKFVKLNKDDIKTLSPIFRSCGYDNRFYMFDIDILKNIHPDMHKLYYDDSIGLIGCKNNPIKLFNSRISMSQCTLKWMDVSLEIFNNTNEFLCLDNNIDFKNLINMRASDGAKQFIIDPYHIIFLFSGLLPILKSDSVFVRTIDNYSSSFLTHFIIKKKKMDVNICMNCLRT